jgi:ABC-type lipoprotein export system ATPase subunit
MAVDTASPSSAMIEVRDVVKIYRSGEVETPVLRGISLAIGRSEMIALMGASGSGKTTLMNVLGCLDMPTGGEYLLDGEDVVHMSSDQRAALRSRKIGFVFQTFNLLPRTSALENVMMPVAYAGAHLRRDEARSRAVALLQRVGLGDRMQHEPARLSGGQQQRVAIARALINAPALLLADEPTGNLDSKASAEILRMLEELNAEQHLTVMLVTHDSAVAGHATRVMRISDGVIVDDRASADGGGET